MEGRLGQVNHEPPALRLRTTDSTVGVGTIDSLWVGRSHAGKGAWIGALALGVPSAIFWSSFCNAVSEGQGCDALDVVAGLTLAGAAVGAGVGALIGSASTHWELSYSRSPLSSRQRRPRMPRIQLGLRHPTPVTLLVLKGNSDQGGPYLGWGTKNPAPALWHSGELEFRNERRPLRRHRHGRFWRAARVPRRPAGAVGSGRLAARQRVGLTRSSAR